MKIPKIIQDKAAEQGFNDIQFIGVIEGVQAFSVGLVDEEGFSLPTGLPTVYLLRDGKVQVKTGEEALSLL